MSCLHSNECALASDDLEVGVGEEADLVLAHQAPQHAHLQQRKGSIVGEQGVALDEYTAVGVKI